MADARVEVKWGNLSFSGEGSEHWVAAQLDKFLKKFPEASVNEHAGGEGDVGGDGDGVVQKGKVGTLAAFLSAKNATVQQVRKFLATAVWLQLRGATRLGTSDVVKA